MGASDSGYVGHIHEYDKETGMCICRKINPSKQSKSDYKRESQ